MTLVTLPANPFNEPSMDLTTGLSYDLRLL